MPDQIGLTALESLTIVYCGNLRVLPKRIGELGALRELTLRRLDQLQEMPDLIRLTALGSLTIELRQAQGAAEGNRQAGVVQDD